MVNIVAIATALLAEQGLLDPDLDSVAYAERFKAAYLVAKERSGERWQYDPDLNAVCQTQDALAKVYAARLQKLVDYLTKNENRVDFARDAAKQIAAGTFPA